MSEGDWLQKSNVVAEWKGVADASAAANGEIAAAGFATRPAHALT